MVVKTVECSEYEILINKGAGADMKKVRLVLCAMVISWVAMMPLYAQDPSGQDSTGLPGDDFSLSGALEMFKKSSSPEEFERMLNTEGNHVNNLDLNGDGEIDYVQVIDTMYGNVHAFVLQVAVSPTESQDVAVIELKRTGNGRAVAQIIGDRDLYGEEVVVEPRDEGGQGGNVNGGDRYGYAAGPPVVVNVWGWPCVRYVYAPGYAVWASPWRWRAYPGWWHPWRPYAWRVYYPYRMRYRAGFAIAPVRRVALAHRIYTPMRRTSVIVRSRNSAAFNHYRAPGRTINHGRPDRVRERARPQEGRGRSKEGRGRTREGGQGRRR